MIRPLSAAAGDRRILLMWGAGMLAVAVLAVSAGAAPPAGGIIPLDKLLHFVVFAGLSALPVLGFADRRAGIVGALAMIPFGGALELLQALTPTRNGSVADAAANAAGVLIGIAAAHAVRRVLTARRLG